MSFRGTGASQTFDSLNAFILKGEPAQGLGLLYDSLLVGSADEPDAAYGLIAESLEYPEDRSWVIFNMRPEAKFSDGDADHRRGRGLHLQRAAGEGRALLPDHPAGHRRASRRSTPHKVKFTFKPDVRQARPARAGRRPLDPAQALLRHRRVRRLHAGAAGRLRPVRGGRRPARQVDQVLPQPRLLGQGSAGERRQRQLRLLRLPVFRRQHRRLRGAEGRRVPVPRGVLLQPLGDRVQFPGDPEGLGQARRHPRRPAVRHPGLLDEPAPREAAGPARPRGDRADVQLRMVERRRCSAGSTSAPTASSRTRRCRPRACPRARSWRCSRSSATSCRRRSSPSPPTRRRSTSPSAPTAPRSARPRSCSTRRAGPCRPAASARTPRARR